jgi:hypothetical protein
MSSSLSQKAQIFAQNQPSGCKFLKETRYFDLKKFYFRSLCVFAGLAVIPGAVTQADSQVPQVRPNPSEDPRLNALRKFFLTLNCPLLPAAELFVAEADSHNLDWRLLPSLAIIESGGGKASHGNNIFGWNNGHAAFPTLGAAIHQVAKTLANGTAYKNKSLIGLLRTYNPVQGYAEKVQFLMSQIAPIQLASN